MGPMKPTAFALSAFFLTVAFAGCVAEDATDKTVVGADADSDVEVDAENGTVNVTVVAAVIVVLIDGNETEPVNDTIETIEGTEVTFDGSQSVGDGLTFAWDFGDNTTAANMTESKSFAPGEFNITLTVTGGDNQTAMASVSLSVAAGGPAPGTLLRTEKQKFIGTLSGVQTTACGWAAEGTDKKTINFEIKAADADGTPIMANRLLLKLTGSQTNLDTDIVVNDPSGKQLGSGTGSTATETIELKQNLLPGVYKIIVMACASVNGSYELNTELDVIVA